MAGMVKGKTLDFAQVMQRVREVLEQLPDARRGKNRHYRMADAGVSPFSVFFMQYPDINQASQELAAQQPAKTPRPRVQPVRTPLSQGLQRVEVRHESEGFDGQSCPAVAAQSWFAWART